MEELIQLRESIEKHDFVAALQIVDQLEEMSVEDKLNKIFSYMIVLLLHLIKEDAEKRLTKAIAFLSQEVIWCEFRAKTPRRKEGTLRD
jgi:Mg/Co/Ni transporter MgtE